jgi:hypothetical protein
VALIQKDVELLMADAAERIEPTVLSDTNSGNPVVAAIQQVKEDIANGRVAQIEINQSATRPIDELDKDFMQYAADRWDD